MLNAAELFLSRARMIALEDVLISKNETEYITGFLQHQTELEQDFVRLKPNRRTKMDGGSNC